jgi:hypothetical protein
MFKAIILGCALCAGAGGTALLVKAGGSTAASSNGAATASVISIQEMHTSARMDGLAVQVVQDLF